MSRLPRRTRPSTRPVTCSGCMASPPWSLGPRLIGAGRRPRRRDLRHASAIERAVAELRRRPPCNCCVGQLDPGAGGQPAGAAPACGARASAISTARSSRPRQAPRPPTTRPGVTDLLCPLLARHEVLLDLHSFQSQGEAFAMIGPRDNDGPLEPFARAFEEGQLALHLGTSRRGRGLARHLCRRTGAARRWPAGRRGRAGLRLGTNEYMRSRGGYGVTLECGQHQDPAAPEVAYQSHSFGLAPARHGRTRGVRHRALAKPSVLRLVSVVNRLQRGGPVRARMGHLRSGGAQAKPIGRRARRQPAAGRARRLHRLSERRGGSRAPSGSTSR